MSAFAEGNTKRVAWGLRGAMESLRRLEDEEARFNQLKSLSVELATFFESQPAATAPRRPLLSPSPLARMTQNQQRQNAKETNLRKQTILLKSASQELISAEKAKGDDETKTKDDRKESTEREEEPCSSDEDSASWDDVDSFAWEANFREVGF
jgi:hypothetical protein